MPWALPLAALTGVFICYRWHWKGVLISFAILLVALIYLLNIIPSSEWLWTSVLALSFASAFVVTVLSLEESQYSWENLYNEIEENKNKESFLSQKLDEFKIEFEGQQQLLSSKNETLEENLKQSHEKIAASEFLLDIARDELTKTHAHQQKLLQELLDARQKVVILEQQLESSRNESQTKVCPTIDQATIQNLQSDLKNLSQEKLELEIAFAQINEDCKTKAQELSHCKTQLMQLQQQSQFDKKHLEEFEVFKQQHNILLNTVQEQKIKLEEILQEKEALALEWQQMKDQPQPSGAVDRERRRFEGLYNQLQNQFAQKSATLDETRKELFQTQEKLAKTQREMDDLKLTHERDIEAQMAKMLKSAECELQQCERQQQEIDQLQEVITALLASKE